MPLSGGCRLQGGGGSLSGYPSQHRLLVLTARPCTPVPSTSLSDEDESSEEEEIAPIMPAKKQRRRL